MIDNEKDLAKAIMRGASWIDLTKDLVGSVGKIISPSEVVFMSVLAALVSSAFFLGSSSAVVLGMTIGLPAVLAVCGGIGGVVFTVLGADGTLCAYKLLINARDIEVIKILRVYSLENNALEL